MVLESVASVNNLNLPRVQTEYDGDCAACHYGVKRGMRGEGGGKEGFPRPHQTMISKTLAGWKAEEDGQQSPRAPLTSRDRSQRTIFMAGTVLQPAVACPLTLSGFPPTSPQHPYSFAISFLGHHSHNSTDSPANYGHPCKYCQLFGVVIGIS